MVLGDTGQITTEIVIKVIEKYVEHFLEGLSLTVHEHIYESFLNEFDQITSLSHCKDAQSILCSWRWFWSWLDTQVDVKTREGDASLSLKAPNLKSISWERLVLHVHVYL